jgi:transcriptional regulator with XRE-family HTH domain
MLDVGRRITEIRTSQGISLTNLAKRSGIAQSSLSYIESGKAQPTVETVNKICTTLGIELHEFFAPDHPPDLPPEVRRVCDKVQKLPPDKLRILNDVLDTWVQSD